jgi:hypothetical protein
VPVHTQPFTLRWTPVEGALLYHVQVKRDGAVILSDWVQGAERSWTADALLPWGSYQWSIDYRTAIGSGIVSDSSEFYLLDFS